MGNISIMARRFSDGHVQYGWSGNGGYFSFTGAHLLEWYQNSDAVEYLFVSEELGVKMVDVPLWKRMHQQEDRFG